MGERGYTNVGDGPDAGDGGHAGGQAFDGRDVLGRLRVLPGGSELLELAAGQDVELVGGAVRDLLLGISPRELDVVVGHDAQAFASELSSRLGALAGESAEQTESTFHERFRTALIRWRTGAVDAQIDVAEARRERYPAPGALPEVEPATLEEDLLRRDFTVNAIAVMLGGQRPGEVLHAAPGALEDLRSGRLRVLHDASFLDDPTRLLRLARYAARLGFEIEPHTAALAAQAVRERALDTVSGGRTGAELRLGLHESDPVGALAAMDELGLLTAIHPRLRIDRATIERALELLPDDGRPDLLIMAAMTLPVTLRAGDDPRAEAAALLNRLEFPAHDRDRIVATAVSVPRLMSELAATELPSRLRDFVRGVPLEGIALAGGVAQAAAAPARRWLDSLRHVRLSITGDDLLAAGLSEGPDVGRRLDRVLGMKLDGDLADGREAELAAAMEATGG